MQKTQVQSLGWKDPWRRKWLPTPIFLPGESHEQRSPWAIVHGVAKEADTTERVTHIFRRSEASSFMGGRSVPVHKRKGREITGTATKDREGVVQMLKKWRMWGEKKKQTPIH